MMHLLLTILIVLTVLPVHAVKLNQRAQWGFLKNIINIDTFFAAPKVAAPGQLAQGGGLETAAQLDDTAMPKQETPEQKAKREAHAKQIKEMEEKQKLKKQIEKEAAEKAVEAMMVGLDGSDGELATAPGSESADAAPEKPVAANEQASEHKADPKQQSLQAYNFTLIYSMPSTPDEVKSQQKLNVTSVKQVHDFYDKGPGLKMLFVGQSNANKSQGGYLVKTNVRLEDNEFEYYRLLGEAYNQHILQRASLAKSELEQLINNSTAGSSKSSLYAYVVDGIPQTQAHNHLFDVKYGYAKMVFVKDKQAQSKTQESRFKIYSSTCKKLAYNQSAARINQCRLATGFFLVSQAGLFLDQCGLDVASLSKCAAVTMQP